MVQEVGDDLVVALSMQFFFSVQDQQLQGCGFASLRLAQNGPESEVDVIARQEGKIHPTPPSSRWLDARRWGIFSDG